MAGYALADMGVFFGSGFDGRAGRGDGVPVGCFLISKCKGPAVIGRRS